MKKVTIGAIKNRSSSLYINDFKATGLWIIIKSTLSSKTMKKKINFRETLLYNYVYTTVFIFFFLELFLSIFSRPLKLF